MSWSYSAVGRPAKIAEDFQAKAQKMEGQSGREMQEAAAGIVPLLQQNFAKEGTEYKQPLISLVASGSGSTRGGDEMQRSVTVKLEPVWGDLLL